METIKTIFSNRIFRIPDYQRGYSWEKSHLDDFWQDLNNLQSKRVHYTGMISVEAVDKEEYLKWTNDQWIITGRGDTPFFIVDGQQRITTIIILIFVISQQIPEDSHLGYNTKEDIINKYIFSESKSHNQKSYLFGYHKDNPSYKFLKREIFEQNDSDQNEIEETAYTNNLLNAKKYFTDKVRKLNISDLEVLFEKLTQQLKFDFKTLEKELDIFIVFETMNNRGKPLSNLEKLKNRLIYLSTLLKDDRKEELRHNINESWKIIYKYLGLNKEQKLEDDSFLQNHWIMYTRYDRREPEFYANDIFDRYFTSKNIISGKEGFDSINKYINSLALSVKQWFVINSPLHHKAIEITNSQEINNWLTKLNRLGFKSFAPLIMGAMVIENDIEKIIKLLKSIESYIFLIFYVSFRRSNTGTYHYFSRANELYRKEISIDDIVNDISLWIYGKDEYKGYYDINGFYTFLKDLFIRENTNGYYDWKFLRYFLYEYELNNNEKSQKSSKSYNQLNEVQHIFPENSVLACWRNKFANFSKQQRKYISGSLGNFVLVSKDIQEDLCFNEKSPFYEEYRNSHDLVMMNDWNATNILNRGLKLLNFMESRWNISLGTKEEKERILFLEFLNENYSM